MSADYPPNGLSESVKKLPEWIQKPGFEFDIFFYQEQN